MGVPSHDGKAASEWPPGKGAVVIAPRQRNQYEYCKAVCDARSNASGWLSLCSLPADLPRINQWLRRPSSPPNAAPFLAICFLVFVRNEDGGCQKLMHPAVLIKTSRISNSK